MTLHQLFKYIKYHFHSHDSNNKEVWWLQCGDVRTLTIVTYQVFWANTHSYMVTYGMMLHNGIHVMVLRQPDTKLALELPILIL